MNSGATPISSAHRMKDLPPSPTSDPAIPSISEYGTFRFGAFPTSDNSTTVESHSDPSQPSLFPSRPKHPSRPKILTELIPFTCLFFYLRSFFGRPGRKADDFFPQCEEVGQYNVDPLEMEMRRYHAGRLRRKFKPVMLGCGRNVPVEILRCLSEWVGILEGRNTVSMNVLSGMYSCITAFEDSLTVAERILTTPLPFVYSAHIRQCVWLYLFHLPFELVDLFGWYTIPGVGAAAFFYLGFLAAGEELEQPFGYDENDLDLDLFCRDYIHAEVESLKRTRCANSLVQNAMDVKGRTSVNGVEARAATAFALSSV